MLRNTPFCCTMPLTGFTRYFCIMRKLVSSHKALGSYQRIRVIRFVESRKRTVGEIADHLGMSINGASYHVHKLHREGFVSLERSGKNTLVFLPQKFLVSKLYQQILHA